MRFGLFQRKPFGDGSMPTAEVVADDFVSHGR